MGQTRPARAALGSRRAGASCPAGPGRWERRARGEASRAAPAVRRLCFPWRRGLRLRVGADGRRKRAGDGWRSAGVLEATEPRWGSGGAPTASPGRSAHRRSAGAVRSRLLPRRRRWYRRAGRVFVTRVACFASPPRPRVRLGRLGAPYSPRSSGPLGRGITLFVL